jgi:SAM-dependent methyltransferase
MGCGTGNHIIPLVERGYEGVGVDLSELMLSEARRKVGDRKVTFSQGDIRSIDLSRQFDSVLMLFAVLGYQVENKDVLAAMKTARRHLRPGGLFVFDVWYGPAVLSERPSQRVKEVPIPDGKILRVASGDLDVQRHICTVHYRILKIVGNQIVFETTESHEMRFFFPQELIFFLESAGFTLCRLGAFPLIEMGPDEKTWNVIAVARAV